MLGLALRGSLAPMSTALTSTLSHAVSSDLSAAAVSPVSRPPLTGRCPVVLLVGASGGVGTTVLAAALASRSGARGHDAVVVEAVRGGLDVVCGVDGWPGVRADDLAELDGPPDAARLLGALPHPGGSAVLAHGCDAVGPPLHPDRLVLVLDALAGVSGLLVVDGGSGVAPPAAVVERADAIVLVSGGQAHQLGRAAALASVLDAQAPPDCGVRVVLTRTNVDPLVVAERLGADGGLTVPDDPSVARDLEAAVIPGSRGRGALVRAVDRLLDELALTAPSRRTRRRARG